MQPSDPNPKPRPFRLQAAGRTAAVSQSCATQVAPVVTANDVAPAESMVEDPERWDGLS